MMQVARKIAPAPWMADAESATVMAALNAGAAIPQALFVGGCVRNELMGLPVGDIDIATRLTPPQVTERLEKAGIKPIPTGIDHGTVTGVTKNRSFEITTLRRDVETDGRHAVIAYTGDWAEDAARRDFTINTLLADGQGNIYDPTGKGLADLAARRVVFVGEPSQRIAEDYLRILRFFRFYACYGSGEPDSATLVACAAMAGKISTLSRERITQEFLKILATPNAAAILDLMFGAAILADLPGDGYDPAISARLIALQERHGLPHTITRLAALAPGQAALQKYLALSNAQKKTLEQVGVVAAAITRVSAGDIRKLIYLHGQDIAGQAILLHLARSSAEADISLIKAWQPPQLPLKGDDLIAAGISPGPALGEALRQVESWWIDRDFTPDRTACLQRLKEITA